MQKVEVKVQVSSNRTVTVNVPDEVPAGEYDFVLWVPDDSSAWKNSQLEANPDLLTEALTDEEWTDEKVKAWETLQTEVSQTKKEPQPVQSDFHKALIEKYRRQGLNL